MRSRRELRYVLVLGAAVAAAPACGGNGAPSDTGTGGDAVTGDGSTSGGDGSSNTGDGTATGMDATRSDGTSSGDIVSGDGTGSDATSNDGPIQTGTCMSVTDSTGTFTCCVTSCRSHVLQCGDCVDNDGDGLIDWHDPDCLGPCDNSEVGYYPNVGGGNSSSCKLNCYFDFGQGQGSDSCLWDEGCENSDPQAPYPAYEPEQGCTSPQGNDNCTTLWQSPQPNGSAPGTCANNCLPLTPNGCDCFGCCTFPELATAGPNGGTGFVYLGSVDSTGNHACDQAHITDPTVCLPCEPVPGCYNSCDPCEVCIGRPAPLPSCNPTPPDGGTGGSDGSTDGGVTGSQCPAGIQPCGLAGQAQCAATYYCVSGCCEMIPG